MKRIVVVDYGLGNLFSLRRALVHVGAQVEIAAAPDALSNADGLVLPGVGAFGDGMGQLKNRGFVDPIKECARSERPILGICLGMQLLFTHSEEFGLHPGLDLIPGCVRKLNETDAAGGRIKIPHVGWSELFYSGSRRWESTLLEGLVEADAMYFVHSYIPTPIDDSAVVARMRYGDHFYGAHVEKNSIAGCQFHPEKSGEMGLRLLRNFIARVKN